MNFIKKIRDNNTFKVVSKVINILAVIVLVGFVLVVCLQRFSNNKISFFNYRMFTVVSNSMEPKYKIGDVLVAKDIEASKIKIGDAISYLSRLNDASYGEVITHQVIKIEKDVNGKYLFTAKGINNPTYDTNKIEEEQLYGIIVYKSVLLSTIYRIVSTNLGFYLFIIVPMAYIIGSEFISLLLSKEEKRRAKVKAK